MDEFGCFRDVPDDYAFLAEHLIADGTIVFSWSRDQVTAYVVSMVRRFSKYGVLPFGGKPDGCILVGVLGFGTFWFSPMMNQSAGYIEEKLRVPQCSAEDLEILFRNIFGNLNGTIPNERLV